MATMATTTPKFDELNNIADIADQVDFDYTKLMKEYFDGMEISEEEKEKRLALAEDLKVALLLFFAAFATSELIAEAELVIRAKAIARQYMGRDLAYVNDYITGKARKVADITRRHSEDTDTINIEGLTFPDGLYWSSEMRATLTAEDVANMIANYDDLVSAFESGKLNKTWLDQRDAKVRPTHRVAGGQTVPIWEPFNVGGYKMMVPCDDSLGAPDEEISNCRCYMRFS